MGKVIVAAAVGIFVGAMVAEIIRRGNPMILRKVGGRIRRSAKAAKDAFMEGYAGTATAS